ncbi:hypothetical protein [Nocardioides flavescens]|uniref:ABC transporter substrate-binding protein n=1 Tax=Nocardioides flavescens TaxID=2691959 RepID=A0A6L7EZD4_9ACTN|nr:hypothetical protein [Nocardioides flavescens]MXG88992.1 hypothetical protein [Nocardioides flavescens]
MKNVARKLAIITGTVAVSVGMLGATAGTADAAKAKPGKSIVKTVHAKDSSWPY